MHFARMLPWIGSTLVLLAPLSAQKTAAPKRDPAVLVRRESASDPAAPAGEQLGWLSAHALPFGTTEAGHGFADLEPLKRIIGDARIVALGEGTHGTREFFQMKHRLVEFLASELGFTIFSIEASTPEAYALDDYVLGGPGDPRALIGGMYFWTWNTEEVLAMVEWMRAFNASGRGPLHFTGFDMQTPDVAMQIVADFLQDVDPERAGSVRARYELMKKVTPRGTFGVATGTFPVELARGKRVRFSGWIMTEGLQDGWAGLWWRNDRLNGELGGFDNMQDRGPRGTSEWAEFALELDVPEDTANINFGLLMPGQGKAWFDSLSIELDGQPFGGERFDLDFENGIRGFSSNVLGYRIRADDTRARSGRKSLCMESDAIDPGGMDPSVAARGAREILDALVAERALLVAERKAQEVDWAIQNARIVDQCLRAREPNGFLVRDQSMAENVAWILEQNPGAKIVLWAHNGHVNRTPGAMGAHLAARFGADYLPVGFTTHEGRYYAQSGQGPGDHDLVPSAPPSIESFFAALEAPRLVLDLRTSQLGSSASGWLREPRPFRSIGALALEDQFYPLVLADAFDVLIYVRTTSAALQLETPPVRR